MSENIYKQISNKVGKDVRLVRKVAHHPFDFFSRSMANVNDHRATRLRYLGVFYAKDYWRKGMVKPIEDNYPEEGESIYARVPEERYGKTYINLKKGKVENKSFISEDGSLTCDSSRIEWWCPEYHNT